MTANLTPEYLEAERRYRQAKTPEEKITALKDMMTLVPKHKGTERLRVDLKKRLAKLQQEAQKKPKVTRAQTWEHIDREGAGQVVLVGLPNSGKSTLLATVTNAQPEIADYPFSTFRPTVGMMPFEDVQIQLIDLPPLSEFAEPWVLSLIRQADAVALLVDLSQPDPSEDVMTALGLLEKARIQLVGKMHPEGPDGTGSGTCKKTLLLATKLDAPGASEALQSLKELYGEEYSLLAISAKTREGLDPMRRTLFDFLEVVRVYTKKPGQPPSKETPHVLPQGSTITQVARSIHHQLAEKFEYARVWGSAEFPGQRVERDHVVKDGDVIEIHA
jgi:ribosome-interacting GTPase 1